MALEGALEALGASPAPARAGGGAEFRVPADVTAKRTVDRLRILQDELGRTTDPEDKAALQREIAGLPKAERAPAAPVSEPGPLSGALEALSTPAEAPAASRAPATSPRQARLRNTGRGRRRLVASLRAATSRN